MSHVWKFSPQREEALLVLLALADFADDDGICWPSMPMIAQKARVTERGARGIVAELESRGELRRKLGGGRGRRTTYVVVTEETRNVVPPLFEDRPKRKPGTGRPETRNVEAPKPGTQTQVLLEPLPEPSTESLEVRPTVRHARLKDEYGEDARAGVAAYYEARRAASLSVDRADCGKLARHIMAARRRGWSQEMCLEAVQAFAASRRATVYFGEWVASVFNARSLIEHEATKAKPPMTLDEFRGLIAQADAVAASLAS